MEISVIHYEFYKWQDENTDKTIKETLTLCNSKDQIPLLQEFPVQSWRSEEEMCDCSQTCPANSWLNVLLEMRNVAKIL